MDPLEIRDWLLQLAQGLDDAPRGGLMHDTPEGMRVIHVSDTLAVQISGQARRCAEALAEVSAHA